MLGGFAVLAIAYVGALYLGFNLPRPAFLERSVAGNAELKVTVLMDNNVKNPLNNIEVDVGEQPGPPAKGGVAITDNAGVATFHLRPGSYVIYFNLGTFPKNLAMPELVHIEIRENQANEKTLLLQTKK